MFNDSGYIFTAMKYAFDVVGIADHPEFKDNYLILESDIVGKHIRQPALIETSRACMHSGYIFPMGKPYLPSFLCIR